MPSSDHQEEQKNSDALPPVDPKKENKNDDIIKAKKKPEKHLVSHLHALVE